MTTVKSTESFLVPYQPYEQRKPSRKGGTEVNLQPVYMYLTNNYTL